VFNQKHLIDTPKSFDSFKSSFLDFLASSYSHSFKLLIKQDVVVGTINTLLINKDAKEEVLDVRIESLENSEISDFEIEIEKEIPIWKNSAKKSKLDTSNKKLIHLLKSFGFREGNESTWFHLKMDKMNTNLIAAFLDDDTPKKHQLTVELNTHLTGKDIDAVAIMMTTLLNDMERIDNHQVFKETPEKVQEIVNSHIKTNSNLFHLLLKNEKSELIGMSILVFKKDHPSSANQYMTGVLKEYRGLGLPSWMKAYLYDYLRKNYPSIKLIKTDCFSGNAPMIHINKKMGFNEVERTTEMIYENN